LVDESVVALYDLLEVLLWSELSIAIGSSSSSTRELLTA
jgi:hypothetical protein